MGKQALYPHIPRSRASQPAVTGPIERRTPLRIEFFADSTEQLHASLVAHRNVIDTTFRAAIAKARGRR